MASSELTSTIINIERTIIQNGANVQDELDAINTDLSSNNGINQLVRTDGNGLIVSSVLPSYIDDVVCYPTFGDFPAVGETCKIYIPEDNPLQSWRWDSNTSQYLNVSGGVSSVNTLKGVVNLTTDSIPVANDKNYISISDLNQITQNTSDISTIEATNTSQQTQITQNTNDISTLQTTDTNLQIQINQNTNDINLNENSITTLNTQTTTQQNQINQNISDIQVNENAITTLQTVDISHEAQINQNTTDITSNQAQITTLQATDTSHQSQIDTINSTISTLQTTDTNLQTQITTNTNDITTINSDINDLVNLTAQNELDIASNLSAITGNTANITTNTSAIDTINNSKGQANGFCELDAGAKVPISKLPTGAMVYKGNYNMLSNVPFLSNATGTSGEQYRVQIGGTRDFGDGFATTANTGDYLIHNGTKFEVSDNTDLVTSVNNKLGAVFINSDDIDDAVYTHKFVTQAQRDQITINKNDITTLTTQQNVNTSNISTLTTGLNTASADIANNTNSININIGNIAQNTTDISTNTVNIGTNTNSISTINTEITSLQNTNTTQNTTLTDHENRITTNTADILTNATDIITNTNAINANTANITTNTANITTNTGDILTNTNAISTIQTEIINIENDANIVRFENDPTNNIISTNRLIFSTTGGGISKNNGLSDIPILSSINDTTLNFHNQQVQGVNTLITTSNIISGSSIEATTLAIAPAVRTSSIQNNTQTLLTFNGANARTELNGKLWSATSGSQTALYSYPSYTRPTQTAKYITNVPTFHSVAPEFTWENAAGTIVESTTFTDFSSVYYITNEGILTYHVAGDIANAPTNTALELVLRLPKAKSASVGTVSLLCGCFCKHDKSFETTYAQFRGNDKLIFYRLDETAELEVIIDGVFASDTAKNTIKFRGELRYPTDLADVSVE